LVVPFISKIDPKIQFFSSLLGLIVLSMTIVAEAAPKGGNGDPTAQKRAACQTQAARRFSAFRFLARRDYVRRCMGETRRAKKG
jgi:hypothetical protein